MTAALTTGAILLSLTALAYAISEITRLIRHSAPARPVAQPVPAAPDNQPGTDPHLLRECRRIARQPLASRKEKP